jgi:hypothetical protein
LLADDEGSAVGLKLALYRIAYNDLSSAQPTGAIPCVVVPERKRSSLLTHKGQMIGSAMFGFV